MRAGSMIGVLVALAASAGCFDPTFAVGLPCDTECPPGQVCRDNVCRPEGEPTADAPPPGTPDAMPGPGDADGDGVTDADDNCPAKPNPDQANEDGDPTGNACDPCPHLAATPETDGDGDGVGDACDPSPGVPGDVIAYFDPFDEQRAAWFYFGDWQVIGGQLRGNATFGPIYAALEQGTGRSTIELEGTVTWMVSGPRQVALSFGIAADDDYHYCELWDGSTTFVGLTRAIGGSFIPVAQTAVPTPLPSGRVELAVVEDAAANTAQCRIEQGARVDTSGMGAPFLSEGGSIGIDLQNGTIAIDYLIQFGIAD